MFIMYTPRRNPRCVPLVPSVCSCAQPHSSQDDIEHQKKADLIVSTVLKKLDKNRDGIITLEELEAVGLDGLPSFDELGAEGHHYDVESGASPSSFVTCFILRVAPFTS